jgi:hypothetical protein
VPVLPELILHTEDLHTEKKKELQPNPHNLYKPTSYFQEKYIKNNKRTEFLQHEMKTKTNFNFYVKGVTALDDPKNYDKKTESEEKYTNAKALIEALGLKHNCAFVIDHMAIALLKILTSGPKLNTTGELLKEHDKRFEICIIDCVETRNDPCGKTLWDRKYNTDEGVDLIFLEPDDPQVVTYSFSDPKSTADLQIPQQMFFSSYKFKLATESDGKGCHLIITGEADQLLLINEVKDPKYENAINYIADKLFKIFEIKKRTPEDVFNTNAKYQQKRSGDWLQVLSCLLLLSRTWKVANKKHTKYSYGHKYDSLFTGGVYFKTHDRIALAYSLLLGISSIFSHGSSSTIICFELEKDISHKLNNAFTACESVYSKLGDIANYFSISEESDIDNIAKLKEITGNVTDIKIKYSEAYKVVIDNLKNDFFSFIETISSILSAENFELTLFENKIKDIFKKLTIISLFEMLYTDPESFKIPNLPLEKLIHLRKIAEELRKKIQDPNAVNLEEYRLLYSELSSELPLVSLPVTVEDFVTDFKINCEVLSCGLDKIKNIIELITKSKLYINIDKQIVSDDLIIIDPQIYFDDLLQPIPESNKQLFELIEKFSFFDLKIFGKFTTRSISSLEISKLDCLQFLQGFSNISHDIQNKIHESFFKLMLNFPEKMRTVKLKERELSKNESQKYLILFTSLFKEVLIAFPEVIPPPQSPEQSLMDTMDTGSELQSELPSLS